MSLEDLLRGCSPPPHAPDLGAPTPVVPRTARIRATGAEVSYGELPDQQRVVCFTFTDHTGASMEAYVSLDLALAIKGAMTRAIDTGLGVETP